MFPNHPWLDNRLRLALLKENREYRELWEECGAAALAEIKEMAAKDSKAITDHSEDSEGRFLGYKINTLQNFTIDLAKFHIEQPQSLAAENVGWLHILTVLNPYSEDIPDQCPIFFNTPLPVCAVKPKGYNFFDLPLHYITAEEAEVEPAVRLLAVDFSRKKNEIMKDISYCYDQIAESRAKNGYGWKCFVDNYTKWEPDTNKPRKETWNHLKVWRLRRQRKTFLQIFQETKIRVDAAKKAFARAYELIEGRCYDPKRYKREYAEIQAPELKKTCSTCPARNDCAELCPDVLFFVDQDQTSLSERQNTPRK